MPSGHLGMAVEVESSDAGKFDMGKKTGGIVVSPSTLPDETRFVYDRSQFYLILLYPVVVLGEF